MTGVRVPALVASSSADIDLKGDEEGTQVAVPGSSSGE